MRGIWIRLGITGTGVGVGTAVGAETNMAVGSAAGGVEVGVGSKGMTTGRKEEFSSSEANVTGVPKLAVCCFRLRKVCAKAIMLIRIPASISRLPTTQVGERRRAEGR